MQALFHAELKPSLKIINGLLNFNKDILQKHLHSNNIKKQTEMFILTTSKTLLLLNLILIKYNDCIEMLELLFNAFIKQLIKKTFKAQKFTTVPEHLKKTKKQMSVIKPSAHKSRNFLQSELFKKYYQYPI